VGSLPANSRLSPTYWCRELAGLGRFNHSDLFAATEKKKQRWWRFWDKTTPSQTVDTANENQPQVGSAKPAAKQKEVALLYIVNYCTESDR